MRWIALSLIAVTTCLAMSVHAQLLSCGSGSSTSDCEHGSVVVTLSPQICGGSSSWQLGRRSISLNHNFPWSISGGTITAGTWQIEMAAAAYESRTGSWDSVYDPCAALNPLSPVVTGGPPPAFIPGSGVVSRSGVDVFSGEHWEITPAYYGNFVSGSLQSSVNGGAGHWSFEYNVDSSFRGLDTGSPGFVRDYSKVEYSACDFIGYEVTPSENPEDSMYFSVGYSYWSGIAVDAEFKAWTGLYDCGCSDIDVGPVGVSDPLFQYAWVRYTVESTGGSGAVTHVWTGVVSATHSGFEYGGYIQISGSPSTDVCTDDTFTGLCDGTGPGQTQVTYTGRLYSDDDLSGQDFDLGRPTAITVKRELVVSASNQGGLLKTACHICSFSDQVRLKDAIAGGSVDATDPAYDPLLDRDLDGDLDEDDLSLLTTEPSNCCRGDLNGDGQVDTADLFLFLDLYFAMDLGADFDGNGLVEVADLFDFLDVYFATSGPCIPQPA